MILHVWYTNSCLCFNCVGQMPLATETPLLQSCHHFMASSERSLVTTVFLQRQMTQNTKVFHFVFSHPFIRSVFWFMRLGTITKCMCSWGSVLNVANDLQFPGSHWIIVLSITDLGEAYHLCQLNFFCILSLQTIVAQRQIIVESRT